MGKVLNTLSMISSLFDICQGINKQATKSENQSESATNMIFFMFQLWPRHLRRFYTVEAWSSCWRWCWPLETTWTRVREETLTASRCPHSTRSQTPNPVSTSKNTLYSRNIKTLQAGTEKNVWSINVTSGTGNVILIKLHMATQIWTYIIKAIYCAFDSFAPA